MAVWIGASRIMGLVMLVANWTIKTPPPPTFPNYSTKEIPPIPGTVPNSGRKIVVARNMVKTLGDELNLWYSQQRCHGAFNMFQRVTFNLRTKPRHYRRPPRTTTTLQNTQMNIPTGEGKGTDDFHTERRNTKVRKLFSVVLLLVSFCNTKV